MNNLKLLIIPLIMICLLITVSCNTFTGNAVGYSGSNMGSHIDGSYKFFDGTQTKTIPVKAGDVVNFSYNSTVETGTLTITLENTEKVKIMEFPTDTSGTSFIGSDKSGNFRLIIVGDNTKGSFDISWKIK